MLMVCLATTTSIFACSTSCVSTKYKFQLLLTTSIYEPLGYERFAAQHHRYIFFHLSPLRILSELQELTDIFLHDNELTGTLPASWFGKGPEGTPVGASDLLITTAICLWYPIKPTV